MSDLNYATVRALGRIIKALAIRTPQLNRDRFDNLSGGFIVSPTHESHIEPGLLSAIVHRKVDWMARLEFYKYGWSTKLLTSLNAFAVNRFGIPVRALKTAIRLVGQGRIVGIFPEGGVARGENSAVRGGRIKLGACLVAVHANKPIVPVVMVGTIALTEVGPWIPFGRARVWVNYGHPIYPRTDLKRRAARLEMGERLKQAYKDLYQELVEEFRLTTDAVPHTNMMHTGTGHPRPGTPVTH